MHAKQSAMLQNIALWRMPSNMHRWETILYKITMLDEAGLIIMQTQAH